MYNRLIKWFVPALLAIVATTSQAIAAAPSSSAPTAGRFWVAGATGKTFMRVEAELVSDGRFARIWLDRDDLGRVARTDIAAISRALDSTTPAGSRDPRRGVIENIRAVFGDSPSRYRIDGKEDILLVDLPDQIEGMTTLGYFQTKDQYPVSRSRYSNERNIIYIDSREGLEDMDRLIGTIAHEYQHLVHFGRNPESEVFFNEGCSELASVLVGYPHSNRRYLADPNVPLLRWSTEDPADAQADYERGMSLLVYLHEQFGDRFIDRFVASKSTGIARIEDALEESGNRGAEGWRGILAAFAVANVLQQKGQGAFGYVNTLHEAGAEPESFTIGAVAEGASNDRRLAPYGTTYHLFDHPGDLALSIDGRGDFVASAIVEDAGGSRIVRLAEGEETRLGRREGSPVTRVMLVLTSLSGRAVDVRWSARTEGRPAVASTALAAATDETLSLVEITPNPISRNGRVVFMTGEGGELTMDLYTRSGDRVGSIAQQMVVEPGRYQIAFDVGDLSSGYYIVRLRVGPRSTAAPVVINR